MVPVGTAHVGCVVTLAVGTAGTVGTAFTIDIALLDADTQVGDAASRAVGMVTRGESCKCSACLVGASVDVIFIGCAQWCGYCYGSCWYGTGGLCGYTGCGNCRYCRNCISTLILGVDADTQVGDAARRA